MIRRAYSTDCYRLWQGKRKARSLWQGQAGSNTPCFVTEILLLQARHPIVRECPKAPVPVFG